MKRYYISPDDLREALAIITRNQTRRGVFVNVTVSEYHGKKFSAGTLVIKEG